MAIKKSEEKIRKIFTKYLGGDVGMLVVCGSVGRQNSIKGWSDLDMLLIIDNITSDKLGRVGLATNLCAKQMQLEVDVMVVDARTIRLTPPKYLHEKLRNYLYFLPREKVLINNNIKFPKITFEDLHYGLWAFFAEQEKNFLKRNANLDWKDREACKTLLKKNIKICFLLLKHFSATKQEYPVSYNDIIICAERKWPKFNASPLRRYVEWRSNDALTHMKATQVEAEIKGTVAYFQEIKSLILKNEKRSRS